jgi:2-hydroxychromene-2-carboxylate isomerase
MRGAVAAQKLGLFEAYVEAVYRAMWVDGLKMDDPAVIETALTAAGLPAAELMALMGDPDVKAQLIANTEDAVAHGVFGSPSFLVEGELFFGKDRLRDVEEEIVSQGAG